MTSNSTANHKHAPSTSSADFTAHQPAHTSHLDPNAQLATSVYAPNDNQLAGLVEAATAAAGQDVSEWAAAAAVAAAAGAAGHHHHLDGYGADMHIEDDGFGDASFGPGMSGGGRQLRGPGPAHGNEQMQSSGLSRTVSRKRKRGEDPLDPALTAGAGLGGGQHHGQQQQHSQQHSPEFGGDALDIRTLPSQQSLSEARAVGVHSAAALFRQSSSNRKNTRPPMSKLFSSLELSPENFLHLQAAAKAYMLDDKHPDRRDCVGQRGKGDTEMVKLKLWNCVRHFLEVEGHGERFFGENVVNEGMGPRTHIWPRDQHKIISLVIPLLRRMVTNERQRQYAIETRKGGGPEERKKRKTEEGIQNSGSPQQYIPDDQSQIQTPQHQQSMQPQQTPLPTPQQHFPEEFAQESTSLPAPPAPQSQMASANYAAQLGWTCLFEEGYPTDWDSVNKSYELYNTDSELDNLWTVSGLRRGEWRHLVAAVDSHYQVYHHGDYECPKPCEDMNLNRIVMADPMSEFHWRVGGNHNVQARNEFATSITRDVSRIIRDNIAAKHGSHPSDQTSQPNGVDHQSSISSQQPFVPQFTFTSRAMPSANTPSGTNAPTSAPSPSNIILRVNIIQDGKRILPRLDLPADQCPDLESMRHAISRRFAGRIPGLPAASEFDASTGIWAASSAAMNIKVWLPDGLVPVANDGEWTIALLSAETVEWMDGNLRVLVEIEGSSA